MRKSALRRASEAATPLAPGSRRVVFDDKVDVMYFERCPLYERTPSGRSNLPVGMGRECILRQYEPLRPDHKDTRSRVRRVRYAERRALLRSSSSGRQSSSRRRSAYAVAECAQSSRRWMYGAFEYSSSSDSDEDTTSSDSVCAQSSRRRMHGAFEYSSSSDSDEDTTSSDSDEDSVSPLPPPEVVEEAAAPHHDSSYGMDVVSLSDRLHSTSLEHCHDVQGWLGDCWARGDGANFSPRARGDGADFSPSGFLGEESSARDESICLAPVVEETVSARPASYGAFSVSRTLPGFVDSDDDTSDSDEE